MNKDKGQITVFVLLGILIVVLAFFMLYIVMINVFDDVEKSEQEILAQNADMEQIDFFIESCVDSSMQGVLKNFSKQGGALYQDQGGLMQRGDVERHSFDSLSYEVAKNLRFEEVCSSSSFYHNLTSPNYPRPNTKLAAYQNIFESNVGLPGETEECIGSISGYSGFFGANHMTKLCYQGSPNFNPDNEFLSVSPCRENFRTAPRKSLEGNLKEIIEEEAIQCIENQPFQDNEGEEIEPLTDESNVDIIFTPETSLVKLSLPFNLTVDDQETTISYFLEFDPENRFVSHFLYQSDVLLKEARDPFFNASRDYDTMDRYESGRFDVSRTHDITEKMSLLQVRDTVDEITFNSAIEARKPVLEYINNHSEKPADKIVLENETLRFEPFGIDPDDTKVSYDYEGFMEEKYAELLYKNPACLQKAPISLQNLSENGVPTECKGSLPTVDPENLTTSQLFQDTGQYANTSLNTEDAGWRETRILLEDRFGKIDYEKVRVAVVDLPHLIMENYSLDTASNQLSAEMPIVVNASKSNSSIITGLGLDTFRAENSTTILKETQDDVFRLFDNIQVIDERIDNMKYINITVNGTANLTDSKELRSYPETINFSEDITMECSPGGNPSQDMFPYGGGNPFLAERKCCNAAGIIKGPSTTCHEEEMSFDLTSLTSSQAENLIAEEVIRKEQLEEYYDIKGIDPTSDIDVTIDNTATVSPENWSVEVERYCDGRRGNICAGDVDVDISNST